MENSSSGKVLGIDAAKYPKICYLLILIASGYGLITNLFGLVGMYLPGMIGLFTGFMGLIGLVLVITGWIVFKNKFTDFDVSHFKYLVIVFVVFLLIYTVVVNMLIGFGAVGAILITLISLTQFALLFAGYRLWQSSAVANMNAVITCIKSGFKA